MVATVTLSRLGLRIEADRAQLTRARRDPTEEQDAVESGRTIAGRTLDFRARACAAAHRPEVIRAYRSLCGAQVARTEGQADAEMWCRVAAAGTAEGDLHRSPYGRFREAEAVLASRADRARAVDAVTAAYM